MKNRFPPVYLLKILNKIFGSFSFVLVIAGVSIPLYQAGEWLETAEWPRLKVNTLIEFDTWHADIAWKGVKLLINEAAIWFGALPIGIVLFIIGFIGVIIYNIIDEKFAHCSDADD